MTPYRSLRNETSASFIEEGNITDTSYERHSLTGEESKDINGAGSSLKSPDIFVEVVGQIK